MKREIKSVAMATLCCLMIFTSCAKTTRNVNNDEQVVSKELSTKDATGKDIPEWVKGSLGEGTLFEKVDIDGIGGADDEVYIITARFDDYGSDYRNGLTVVYVHLGTGEVLAQAILCKGNYETRFANLIPGHEGNQIILEITDGNSTYLATNIFVIAVSVDKWQVGENDADVMRVPVISKLLDTTDYDRPVGGIMVFARTSKAASRLSEQIRNKTFKKKYLAVVDGKFENIKGSLEDYLYKDERNNISKVVNKDKKNAKLAKLDYEVLAYNEVKNLSLVRVNLHTGRHHQIRVQLSHAGHSIFGDQKYGTRGQGKQIALWAYELTIEHPITKEEMIFKCLPESNGTWCILRDVSI